MLSDKQQALLQALKNSSVLNPAKIGQWKLLLVANPANDDAVVNLPQRVDFIILVEPNKVSQAEIVELNQLITTDILIPLKEKNGQYYAFSIETPNSFRNRFADDYSLSEQAIDAALGKAADLSNLCQLISIEDNKKKVTPPYANLLTGYKGALTSSTNKADANDNSSDNNHVETVFSNPQQLEKLRREMLEAFSRAGMQIKGDKALVDAMNSCAKEFAKNLIVNAKLNL